MNPACRMLWSDFGWRRCEGIAAKEGKKEESSLLALSPTCVLTPVFALLACSGLHRVQFEGCTASRGSAGGLSASFGACDEGAGGALSK
eukprot:COSAG05_NODE_2982_length_2436_cov_4.558408_2_plen_89_part_00